MAILPVVQEPPEAPQEDNQGFFNDPFYDDVVVTSVYDSCKCSYGAWGLGCAGFACKGRALPISFDLSCKIALVACCVLCAFLSVCKSCLYFWESNETIRENIRVQERRNAQRVQEEPICSEKYLWMLEWCSKIRA